MFIKSDGLFFNLNKFEHFKFETQERDGVYCIEFDLYKKSTDEEPSLCYLSQERISTWEAAERCLFCIEELMAELIESSKFCDIGDLIETQMKVSHLRVKCKCE